MRVMTWNCGHGSPGARRAAADQQWGLIGALSPDVVLLQEARAPESDQYGFDVVGSTYPNKGWGAIVAVRRGFANVEHTPTLDRPGLVAGARVTRSDGRVITIVSVHIPSKESGRAFVRELMAGVDPAQRHVVVGGDFNAGPGIGTNPATFMPDHLMDELTTSEPERNTLVRPQHPGTTFQIDHVFGRGFAPVHPMCVLPLADLGGPQMSDHNALWVELSESGA